ncbi:MAG: response regulator [Deltaproteobacteria bacterium]
MEELMTLEEAAEYLKIAKPTLYRLLEEGKIPAFKVGNQWRFTKELINQWLWNQIPKGKRVLVVDDEEIICDLIKEVLSIDGHQCVAVQSGKEALSWVKSSIFDLVFLDLMIPDMNGVDVLTSIKQIKPELPVVMVTGYPDGDIMDQALRLGPLSVIKKPFTDEQIRRVLKITSATAHGTKEKTQARSI